LSQIATITPAVSPEPYDSNCAGSGRPGARDDPAAAAKDRIDRATLAALP
jgi:hypothetical protein